ncbi:MAG: S-layer homology domain-containing protein [Pseudanabaenaceae cyanobacterium]
MKKLALLSLALLLVSCANTPIGESLSTAIAPQKWEAPPTLPPGFPLPIAPPGQLLAARGNDREGWLVFNVSNSADALQSYQKFFRQQEWENLSQTNQQLVVFNQQYLVTVSSQGQELSLYYLKLQNPLAALPPPVSPPPPAPPAAVPSPPDSSNPYLRDLQKLGVIPVDRNMNATISRREYARWLVTTHNRFFSDPAQQIRPALPDRELPLFRDVPQSDPDFGFIQGLANAGIIDRSLQEFQPDRPLTREVMVQWKIPLDLRRPIPPASSNAVQNAWNFQDSDRISPSALGAVLQDSRLGELSNIRRSFGFTTLFQPGKHVSRLEAALSLWYFGDGEKGISAKEVLQLASRSD